MEGKLRQFQHRKKLLIVILLKQLEDYSRNQHKNSKNYYMYILGELLRRRATMYFCSNFHYNLIFVLFFS